MVVAGELCALVDLLVELAQLALDVPTHVHHCPTLGRHLVDLVPRALQLLRFHKHHSRTVYVASFTDTRILRLRYGILFLLIRKQK